MNRYLILLLPFLLVACTKVPAGNVGVKVFLLGGEKGVDTEELGPGRYWIGWNEDLFIFPTFTQNYTWTKSATEGSPNDESMSFQTVEGLVVGADIGISYHVNPEKVSAVFQKYRKGIEEITDIYLRNMVRDALVNRSSTLPIENVYGKGKAELIKAVQADVINQVRQIGIEVEKVYWIGDLRLPQTVVKALNAKIEATQKAQQRENEVAQAKAEADKAIEQARGQAESRLINAKAEAEAITIKGDALRRSKEVLKLAAIEKWNGILPRFTGNSAIPFVQVPEK